MTAPTVLITGANTGIGFATAEHLLKQGAEVILACRNPEKAALAQQKLLKLGKGRVERVQLDLSSLAQVNQAAQEIMSRFGTLDVLINNAGLFAPRKGLTRDGFEQQFGVNYLGHFLLTQKLLPLLHQAPAGRIIHLASIAHWVGHIRPESFYGQGFYNPLFYYGQSKLANLLFSHELARRLTGSGVTSNALHPGGVDSDIYRQLPRPVNKAMQLVLVPPSRPARLITQMALSPGWSTTNGAYVSAHMPDWQSPPAKNTLLATRLYEQSLELVQPYL